MLLLILIFISLLTPVIAFLISRFSQGSEKKVCLLIGATGPTLLLIWLFQEALILIFGFSSFVTLFLSLIASIVAGVIAGRWAAN